MDKQTYENLSLALKSGMRSQREFNFFKKTIGYLINTFNDQLENVKYLCDGKGEEIMVLVYKGNYNVYINVACNSSSAILLEIAKEVNGGKAFGRISSSDLKGIKYLKEKYEL